MPKLRWTPKNNYGIFKLHSPAKSFYKRFKISLRRQQWMQSRRSKKIFQHQDASIRSLCFLLSLLQGWRGRNFGVFVPILLKRSRKFFRTLKTASSSQVLQSRTFYVLYTCLIINCKRFEPRSHFISKWSMIVRVNLVLNRTVVDSNWCFDKQCGGY